MTNASDVTGADEPFFLDFDAERLFRDPTRPGDLPGAGVDGLGTRVGMATTGCMIPDRVVEFIHGPVFIQIGTRDVTLRPAHTMGVGARVHDDRQTVTGLVPTARADRVLRDLADNRRVAFTTGHVNHESYQIKGTYLSTGPADAEDRSRQEAWRAALLASALEAGFPEPIARPFTQGFAYTPAVTITFRAEEVYQQTPGPDAGSRLA